MKDNIKVAFFTPEISKSKGGIQNTSYYLVEELSKSLQFSYFSSGASEIDGEIPKGYLSHFNSGGMLHLDLIKNAICDYRKYKYQFSFSILYPYALPCYILKILWGVPYGVMVHGNELMRTYMDSDRIITKLKGKIKEKLRQVILNKADIIFANSNYTKKLCSSLVTEEKIKIIHPPIKYIEKYQDLNNYKTYSILSIGRLVERKGFQYVIEALSKTKDILPNLTYYIAGDGEYKSALQEMIHAHDLDAQVFLLGRVSEEKKDELYKSCDYFIMPSYEIDEQANVEGFGIVYLEANMYGKFVIATKSGGIPDAIIENKTGIFVEEENSDSIASALTKLYSDDFSYDINECLKWAHDGDIKVIASQYCDYIKAIIK